jgi:hypothetical protein
VASVDLTEKQHHIDLTTPSARPPTLPVTQE